MEDDFEKGFEEGWLKFRKWQEESPVERRGIEEEEMTKAASELCPDEFNEEQRRGFMEGCKGLWLVWKGNWTHVT